MSPSSKVKLLLSLVFFSYVSVSICLDSLMCEPGKKHGERISGRGILCDKEIQIVKTIATASHYYLMAEFEHKINISTNLAPITSFGSRDIVLAKFEYKTQRVSWVKSIGCSSTDVAYGMVLSSDGVIISVLLATGLCEVAGTSYSNPTSSNHLIKLSNDDGSLVWMKKLLGPSTNILSDMVFWSGNDGGNPSHQNLVGGKNGAGIILATGKAKEYFGLEGYGKVFPNIQEVNVFVTRIDESSGEVHWVRFMGDPNATETPFAIEVDAIGDSYIAICSDSSNHFLFGNQTLKISANSGLILSKYDSNGNALWIQYKDTDIGICKDYKLRSHSGRVMVVGEYVKPIVFSSNTTLSYNSRKKNLFIATYNAESGNFLNASSINLHSRHFFFYDIDPTMKEVIVVTDIMSSVKTSESQHHVDANYFVLKFSTISGKLEWIVREHGAKLDQNMDSIAFSPEGYIFFNGIIRKEGFSGGTPTVETPYIGNGTFFMYLKDSFKLYRERILIDWDELQDEIPSTSTKILENNNISISKTGTTLDVISITKEMNISLQVSEEGKHNTYLGEDNSGGFLVAQFILIIILAFLSILSLIFFIILALCPFFLRKLKEIRNGKQMNDIHATKEVQNEEISNPHQINLFKGYLFTLFIIGSHLIFVLAILDVIQNENKFSNTNILPRNFLIDDYINGSITLTIDVHGYNTFRCMPEMKKNGIQGKSFTSIIYNLMDSKCSIIYECLDCSLLGLNQNLEFSWDHELSMASAIEYVITLPHYVESGSKIIISDTIYPHSSSSVFRGYDIPTLISFSVTPTIVSFISGFDYFFFNIFSNSRGLGISNMNTGFSVSQNPVQRGSMVERNEQWNGRNGMRLIFEFLQTSNAYLIQQNGRYNLLDFIVRVSALHAAMCIVILTLICLYQKRNESPMSNTEQKEKIVQKAMQDTTPQIETQVEMEIEILNAFIYVTESEYMYEKFDKVNEIENLLRKSKCGRISFSRASDSGVFGVVELDSFTETYGTTMKKILSVKYTYKGQTYDRSFGEDEEMDIP